MESSSERVTWDPGQYGCFADDRQRPALELASRVEHRSPGLVCDLGCGTGDMSSRLAERWPAARVLGVDLSAAMLERAAGRAGRVEWERADLATWEPPGPVDVLYSNAALHWVDDHETLLPRLFGQVAPGGVLAFQVPLSWWEPSHRCMREVLECGGTDGRPLGSDELRARMASYPVLAAADYDALLAPHASAMDVWETRYQHVLEGPDPVLEWVRGTGLRPVLEGLAGEELDTFLDAYRVALREAYPARDGRTLFPFPRLFVVARRAR